MAQRARLLCHAAALLLLSALLVHSQASLITISTSAELLAALNTSSIDRIVLLQDVAVSGAEWRASSGFPLHLGRNVTITGGLGAFLTPKLDLQYLTKKIALDPGVTVTMEDLCLVGSVTQAGPGLEFAALSMNASFVFRNVVIRRLVCLPPQQTLDNMRTLARPKAFAGRQQLVTQRSYCYNASDMAPQCSSNATLAVDFAFVPANREGDAVSGGGFTVQYLNVPIVCDFPTDPDCLKKLTAELCLAQDLAERLGLNTESGDDTARELRIVLPAVLGGVALGLVLLGLLLWHKRSRHAPSSEGKDWQTTTSSSNAAKTHHSTGIDAGSHVTVNLAAANCSIAPDSLNHQFSTERVEELRRVLVAGSARPDVLDQIVLVERIGMGNFGKVYRGYWSGIPVAIKTLSFGGSCSSTSDQQQRMALMEAAISCSISHPNVVQTYTYSLATTQDDLAKRLKPAKTAPSDSLFSSVGVNGYLLQERGGPSTQGSRESLEMPFGWEVRLVLEFCDMGSLREALDRGALRGGPGFAPRGTAAIMPAGLLLTSDAPDASGTSSVDFLGLVDIALDVCRGLVHLHSKNIVHSDLKARNILLKSTAPSAPTSRDLGTTSQASSDTLVSNPSAALTAAQITMRLGVVAKVADFGLSLVIEPQATHISNVYQGTLTHMAPEVLIHGHLSKAADVYSFGILLWELLTGHHAFAGVPRALLAHRIGMENERPPVPPNCPPALASMMHECWQADPLARPSFETVLKQLQALRSSMCQGADLAQMWTYIPPAPNSRKEYDTQPSSVFSANLQSSGGVYQPGLIDTQITTGSLSLDMGAGLQQTAGAVTPNARTASRTSSFDNSAPSTPALSRALQGGRPSSCQNVPGGAGPSRVEHGSSSGSYGSGNGGSSGANGPHPGAVQNAEDVLTQHQLAAANLILIGDLLPARSSSASGSFSIASPGSAPALAPIPEMSTQEEIVLHLNLSGSNAIDGSVTKTAHQMSGGAAGSAASLV